jgi:hypothetical protein
MGLIVLLMPHASVTTIGDASWVVVRFGDVKDSAGMAAFFAICKEIPSRFSYQSISGKFNNNITLISVMGTAILQP